jgi:hypothetical protein
MPLIKPEALVNPAQTVAETKVAEPVLSVLNRSLQRADEAKNAQPVSTT